MSDEAGEFHPERPDQAYFLGRREATLLTVGLVIYVVLLLVGTVGNLFEIRAITSFWLYR